MTYLVVVGGGRLEDGDVGLIQLRAHKLGRDGHARGAPAHDHDPVMLLRGGGIASDGGIPAPAGAGEHGAGEPAEGGHCRSDVKAGPRFRELQTQKKNLDVAH